MATAVSRSQRTSEAPLREALLKTSILIGVLTVLAVEGLSLAKALAAFPLAIFWGATLAGSLLVATRHGSARPALSFVDQLRDAREVYGARRKDRILLAIAATFAAITIVIAIVVPTNNWDAMTYHMPRVAHWLANASLRHYPVARAQQLFMPPLNAYGIAVLQALAGTDRWANLVQWLAYVGGALIASLAVRRLRGGPTSELAAALAFLTLPMAVAQAATAQSDLLTAYWVLALATLVVGPLDRGTPFWVGATVGLGVLTKPSFALYATPLVLALLVRQARRHDGGRRASVPAAAIGLVLTAVVAAPHAWRTTETFGLPWGGGYEAARMQNENLGVRSWLSNIARTAAVHLPVPGFAAAVIRAHGLLGVDPDDPRATHVYDLSFSEVASQWFRPLIPSEDSVGNPAHFVTAIALFGIVLVRRRSFSRSTRTAIAVGVLATAGWLLMCVPFKWQAWTARFDLPFFAALCVPLGIAMGRLPSRAASLVMGAWLIGALPVLTMALHRPLLSIDAIVNLPPLRWGIAARAGSHALTSVLGAREDELLFRSNRSLRAPYLAAIDAVRASGCEVVGLELERDDWEYPFWRLLGDTAGPLKHGLQGVGVTNETAHLPPEGPEPCLVVSSVKQSALRDDPEWEAMRPSIGRRFTIYRRRG